MQKTFSPTIRDEIFQTFLRIESANGSSNKDLGSLIDHSTAHSGLLSLLVRFFSLQDFSLQRDVHID